MKTSLITLLALAATLLPYSGHAGSCATHCKSSKQAKTCTTGVEVENKVAKVTTSELNKVITSGEQVVLVDARSGKYDDGKRIASAKNVSSSASESEILKALPDKNAKIIAYCSNTKCPAGEKLAKRLVELGYSNVSKYPEGIQGWVDAGNKVN